jgi:hypothetical protein
VGSGRGLLPVDGQEQAVRGLDRRQVGALKRLCRLLPLDRVNWALTGSAGHALQGVPVEVHDIDVQTDKVGAYAVAAALADDAVEPVRFIESGVMKSHLGRFRLDGVLIEVMGAVQTRTPGSEWLPTMNPADHRLLVPLGDEGLQVPVLSLGYEAEAYDRIGRRARAQLLRQHLP